MNVLRLVHTTDDRMHVLARGHRVIVDQPLDAGGTDSGMTPVELFVGGLAACVAHYAHRYLRRHHLPEDPLEVMASWTMAASPARVAEVNIELTAPAGLSAERLRALTAVASHCTVHNSLVDPPRIRLHVDGAESDGA